MSRSPGAPGPHRPRVYGPTDCGGSASLGPSAVCRTMHRPAVTAGNARSPCFVSVHGNISRLLLRDVSIRRCGHAAPCTRKRNRSCPIPADIAGIAALSICESLLLALNDSKTPAREGDSLASFRTPPPPMTPRRTSTQAEMPQGRVGAHQRHSRGRQFRAPPLKAARCCLAKEEPGRTEGRCARLLHSCRSSSLSRFAQGVLDLAEGDLKRAFGPLDLALRFERRIARDLPEVFPVALPLTCLTRPLMRSLSMCQFLVLGGRARRGCGPMRSGYGPSDCPGPCRISPAASAGTPRESAASGRIGRAVRRQ